MSFPRTPTIAILAGGQSRRMGEDKSALTLDGPTTLLERTARTALAAIGDPTRVLVIGRTAPVDWPLPAIAFLPDETPGLGPLGGLVTALHHGGKVLRKDILLIGCDMPALSTEAIGWLFGEWEKATASLVGPGSGRRRWMPPPGIAATRRSAIQPLFAVYSQRCRKEAEVQLRDGQLSLRSMIQDLQQQRYSFVLVEIPDTLAHTLTNLNTPEDLARYRGGS